MRPCLILFSSSLFLASLQLQLQMFIANHEGNDKHYIKQYLGGTECTVCVFLSLSLNLVNGTICITEFSGSYFK